MLKFYMNYYKKLLIMIIEFCYFAQSQCTKDNVKKIVDTMGSWGKENLLCLKSAYSKTLNKGGAKVAKSKC